MCKRDVLAGDIWRPQGSHGVGRRCALCRALYVAGNHEFYGSDLATTMDALRAGAAGTESDAQVLERTEWHYRGVRFLGCTLWSDYRLFASAQQREDGLRDASVPDAGLLRIRVAPDFEERFTPATSQALFRDSASWLDERFQAGHDGKTVVITHFAPSPLSISPKFRPAAPQCQLRLRPEPGDPGLAAGSLGARPYARQLRLQGGRHAVWCATPGAMRARRQARESALRSQSCHRTVIGPGSAWHGQRRPDRARRVCGAGAAASAAGSPLGFSLGLWHKSAAVLGLSARRASRDRRRVFATDLVRRQARRASPATSPVPPGPATHRPLVWRRASSKQETTSMRPRSSGTEPNQLLLALMDSVARVAARAGPDSLRCRTRRTQMDLASRDPSGRVRSPRQALAWPDADFRSTDAESPLLHTLHADRWIEFDPAGQPFIPARAPVPRVERVWSGMKALHSVSVAPFSTEERTALTASLRRIESHLARSAGPCAPWRGRRNNRWSWRTDARLRGGNASPRQAGSERCDQCPTCRR
ncbi:hypothetical protein ACU4GD_22675 [Cupriavidus basilensis]